MEQLCEILTYLKFVFSIIQIKLKMLIYHWFKIFSLHSQIRVLCIEINQSTAY